VAEEFSHHIDTCKEIAALSIAAFLLENITHRHHVPCQIAQAVEPADYIG
jgi:hypothetical protein